MADLRAASLPPSHDPGAGFLRGDAHRRDRLAPHHRYAVLQTVVGSSLPVGAAQCDDVPGRGRVAVHHQPELTGLAASSCRWWWCRSSSSAGKVRRLSRASAGPRRRVGAEGEETLDAVRTVQAFTHERSPAVRFTGAHRAGVRGAALRSGARALLTAIVILLVFGAIASCCGSAATTCWRARMSAGDLSAFIFYAVLVASAVGAMARGDAATCSARPAPAERLVELLDDQPTIAAPAHPRPLPEPARGARRLRGRALPLSHAARTAGARRLRSRRRAGREAWRSSGPRAPARPRSSSCCCASTTRRRARILLDGVDIARARPARAAPAASASCRRSR